MTTLEIQQKLLAYYTEKLAGLPMEMDEVEWYLINNHIDMGVCKCANFVIHELIYHKQWVKAHGLAWDTYPLLCTDRGRPAVISALQTRISILTSLTSLTSAQPNK